MIITAGQAVILAGGLGSRLGSLTSEIPKPLLLVNQKPFLDYLIERILKTGIDNILLLTGYRGEQIADYYRDRPYIQCIQEKTSMGTAGALINVHSILEDYFLMLNGDTLFSIDYLALIQSSNQNDGLMNVALRKVQGDRYARMQLDDRGCITAIRASSDEECPINGGVYVVKKAILSYIGHYPMSLEQDVFPKLIKDKVMYGSVFDDYFIDIGIPEDYMKAQSEL